MFRRSVGLAAFAASALQASAFPISIDLAYSFAKEAVPSALSSSHTQHQLVTLPCPECAFVPKKSDVREETEPSLWIQGGANSVAVNLTVSEDGKRLEVNGRVIYPMRLKDIFMNSPIYVSQVPSSASVQDIESGSAKAVQLKVTGSGIAIGDQSAASREGDSTVPIAFSISGLNRQHVSLDKIVIELSRTASGVLSILHTSIHASRREHLTNSFWPSHHYGQPPSQTIKGEGCGKLPAFLCKLQKSAGTRMKGLRMRKGGCHGRKGKLENSRTGLLSGHTLPYALPAFLRTGTDAPDAPVNPTEPLPDLSPGDSNDEQAHHGYWIVHALSQGFSIALIPSMVIIAAVMAVSLIGLLFGRLIGFTWTEFSPRRRRGYTGVPLDDDIADDMRAEKELAIECGDVEAPPIYEAAPPYEDASEGSSEMQ